MSPIFQALFESIDPEALTNQVMKYHKTVIQLEKGLPPNAVVPQLRGKVDSMRHKVQCCLSRDFIVSEN